MVAKKAAKKKKTTVSIKKKKVDTLPKAVKCCKHCQDYKYCDEVGKCCEYCDHFVNGKCSYHRDKKLFKDDTDFVLEDYRGQTVRLTDYRGQKHAVLVFNRGFS